MNALSSNSKCLVLSFGLLALVACSAEASAPPSPNGNSAGNTSTSNGGSGGSSTGGNGTNLPVAGTTTTLPTAGTTSTGTGGVPATGTAGSAPTAGTSTGSAGGGALTVCPSPPAAGTAADLLIDNVDDGDNGIGKIGGRSGYWYTYADTNGTMITPMPDTTKANPLKASATNCHSASAGCIAITGTTSADDLTVVGMEKYGYAGVGFDFSNAMKSCVYNGTAYSGIRFYARGDVAITIKLNTTATVTAAEGGTCTTNCAGFSPTGVDVLLEDPATWQLIDIPFATAMQPTWATAATLDKAALISLQVQIPPGQTFNVALDDFTFY